MSSLQSARQSAKGSVILSAGNFLSTAILAGVTIIVARLLGPESYGAYTLVLVVPSIFQLFVGLGVNSAVTRYASYYISRQEFDQAKRITKNAIAFLALFGAGLTLASFLGAEYLSAVVLHRTELYPLVQVASVSVFAQTLIQLSISAFMGWGSAGLAGLTSILQAILKASIMPLLIIIGLGVYGAVLGQLASTLLAGVVGLVVLYLIRLPRSRETESRFYEDIKEMISYSLPLFSGYLTFGLASQYLTIILAITVVNTEIGYYQAATNVTVAITIFSSAITSALFPAFSGLDGVKGDTTLAFRYAVKYVSYLMTPIAFFLVASSDALFSILYGQFYASGVTYLKLLGLSYAPVAIGLTVTPVFFSSVGRTRSTMVMVIAGAAAIFTTGPILTRQLGLGVGGVIYSTAISNLVLTLTGLVLAKRLLGAKMDLKASAKILLVSLLSCIVTLAVAQWIPSGLLALLIDAVVFFGVYLTLAPVVGAINEADIARLSIAMEGLGSVTKISGPVLRYERMLSRRKPTDDMA